MPYVGKEDYEGYSESEDESWEAYMKNKKYAGGRTPKRFVQIPTAEYSRLKKAVKGRRLRTDPMAKHTEKLKKGIGSLPGVQQYKWNF